MRQAALALRAREAGLDRLDDARRAVQDHEQRIAQAAGAHVLEERAHRLGVLLGAGHQMQENPGAGAREAPGRQHGLAPLPGPKPLRDPVDEQINDVVFAQIAGDEVLVVRPQPLAQLGYRRPGQQQPPRPVLEGVLDVAYRKPTRQHLDRQILQRLAVALQMPAQLRAERLGRAGNLRRRIADEALRRLETTLANAIAIALASHLPVLVIISAKCVANLRLKTFLDDQARRQPHQFAAPRLRRQTSLDQVSKPFSRPFTPWYPSRHGGASFHGPANARPVEIHTSKGCTSSKFPSKSRTSPLCQAPTRLDSWHRAP